MSEQRTADSGDIFTDEQHEYVNSLGDDPEVLKSHLLHQIRLRDNMESDRDSFEKENQRLENIIIEMRKWSDEDEPIPEDEKIHEAHPLRTDDHDTYMEALRMVSAKRSKYALVDLVNWLLCRIKCQEKTINAIQRPNS